VRRIERGARDARGAEALSGLRTNSKKDALDCNVMVPF